MKTTKKLIAPLTCAAVLAAGVYYVQSARSETRLNSLLTKGVGIEQHGYDPAKEPARKERAWKLYQLWLARHDRDIAAEVVPFLHDEYWLLRHNAVRILGRTESPLAEPHLQKLLTEVQQQRSAAIRQRAAADPLRTAPKPMLSNPETLRLALARTRTRDLKGRAKLEAFARGMGLSFEEAVQLTAEVRASRSKASGSDGEKIMREMVDMLYTMGKSGEDIKPLADQLTLYPAQKLLLEGAGLPPEQEAKLLVNYLAKLDILTLQDAELTQLYLAGLNVHVTRVAVQRLIASQEGQAPLGGKGRSALLSATKWSISEDGLELLQPLEKNKESWMYHFAIGVRKHKELLEQWSSPLSPTPPTIAPMLEL